MTNQSTVGRKEKCSYDQVDILGVIQNNVIALYRCFGELSHLLSFFSKVKILVSTK